MVRNKNLLTHRARDTETLKHIFHYVTTSASTRKQQRYLFVQPYACLPFLPEADFCPRPHVITLQPLNNQYPTETSSAFVHFKTERFHSTSSYHTDSQDVPETPRMDYSFSFLSMVTNSQAQPRTEVRRKQKDPEKHAARGLIAGGPVRITTEVRRNEVIIMLGG